MNRGKLFVAAIVLLYAATWIGGYFSHRHELAAEAAEGYAYVQKVNRERNADIALNLDGPDTGISWSFPVLPGVLVVDSYSVLGPLIGHNSTKVVLYYGFGSVVLAEGGGWRA